MPDTRADHACCDRCAGGATAARIARRRLLKAAVFRPADAGTDAMPHPGRPASAETVTDDAAGLLPGSEQARFATSGELPRAVTGTILDVSPNFLVISHGTGEERFALTPDAIAWRGGPCDPEAPREENRTVSQWSRHRDLAQHRRDCGRAALLPVDHDCREALS